MNATLAIYKKELRGFVFNPNFILVCALCATVLSWVYPFTLEAFRQQSQHPMFAQMQTQEGNIHFGVFLKHLSFVNLLLIFVVPVISMRLFAEEKKLRTFDLLLTSPVTSAQIVLGKYLALLSAIFIVMFLGFLYPAMTSLFAKFNWLILLIAFLGIFMVAAVYAAMDLFCSSLTESAIVALVMAVVLNFSIWFVGYGVDAADSGTMRAVFEHIALNSHLTSIVQGTIRTSSLIFFASVIFLFGFLSERVVESARWR
jgi:ABC-2 type transport system permease protein